MLTKKSRKAGSRSARRKFIYGAGKRRTASARVRLFKGKGENLVNNKSVDEYFGGLIEKDLWKKPFEVTGTSDKYYISVRAIGGGKNGQLTSITLGIARALAKADPGKYKPLLRKAGLLTRDSRIRERRKVGMGGKSRRKKQSPKR